MDSRALAAVLARAESAGLVVHREFPLAAKTTLGVGGPAAGYVELADQAAAAAFAAALTGTSAEQVPVFVLGKGSNTLLSDAGFPGVVVHLGRGHKWLRRQGSRVSAGAGEAMPALAAWVAREGLAGMEFAAGIPATVGGSVRMNAGAHGSAMDAVLTEVDVLPAASSQPVRMPVAELKLAYRSSQLPDRTLILAAHFALSPDDPARIRTRLDELRAWRRAAQPLRDRNCGSVFTNPDGDYAARWIEAAGGKQIAVGGAQVSAKHANFIVARPGTRADDVYAVICAVRTAVRTAGGPLLAPEVRLVGRFPAAGSACRPGTP